MTQCSCCIVIVDCANRLRSASHSSIEEPCLLLARALNRACADLDASTSSVTTRPQLCQLCLRRPVAIPRLGRLAVRGSSPGRIATTTGLTSTSSQAPPGSPTPLHSLRKMSRIGGSQQIRWQMVRILARPCFHWSCKRRLLSAWLSHQGHHGRFHMTTWAAYEVPRPSREDLLDDP